jgi:hypothetical protein
VEQREALSQEVFSFSLEYAIRMDWNGNGRLQFLLYIDGINMQGESIYTIKNVKELCQKIEMRLTEK